MTITSYERAILTVLLRRRVWLNTTQIADATRISWNTAKNYLERMYNRGWLSRKGNYWRVRK
jgi:DNA-binding IclR family transcriptional regulator